MEKFRQVDKIMADKRLRIRRHGIWEDRFNYTITIACQPFVKYISCKSAQGAKFFSSASP